MLIRPEIPADIAAIHTLTEDAFAPMSFSDDTEADCITKMRDDGDLTLSLVAVESDVIIGHAAFSPVKVDDVFDGWYGLGPISVVAPRQKQGIGTTLVDAGSAALEKINAKGLILIGNPAVYRPMGFTSDGTLFWRDLTPSLVQYRAFMDETPSGKVTFVPALDAA